MSDFYSSIRRKLTVLSALAIVCAAATAQPVISSFSPIKGDANTSVTITGTGFNSTADSNTVYFGSVPAEITSASTTSLTVKVPIGALYDFIRVTTNRLSGYSAARFLPTFRCGRQLDSVTSFDPGETLVTSTQGAITSVVCEMNHKPYPEILAVSSDSSVNVAVNATTTAGNFYTTGAYIFRTIRNPSTIATGDLDGDGWQDFVTGSSTADTIAIHMNLAFSVGISFKRTFIAMPAGVKAGRILIHDLNADGKLDIVVASRNGYLVIYKNNVSGTVDSSSFTRTDILVTSATQMVDMGIADMDNDGDPDLVSPNFNQDTMNIFRNNGSFSFTRTPYKLSLAGCRSMALNDFDGDGLPDIAGCYRNSSVFVIRNTTSGGAFSLGTEQNLPLRSNNIRTLALATNDLDGDGKSDLAVIDTNGFNVSILKNTSTSGTIAFNKRFGLGRYFRSNFISLADMDMDGMPDLIISQPGVNGYHLTYFIRNNSSPVAFITAARDYYCASDSVQLWNKDYNYVTYQWSLDGTDIPGATDYIYYAKQVGTYTVTLTDTGSCTKTAFPRKIGVDSVNVQSIQVTGTPCDGDTVQLSVPYDPDYIYSWIRSGYSVPGDTNLIKAGSSANYTLVVRNSKFCRKILTRPVTFTASPAAGFTVDTDTAQCLSGNVFSFTNTSAIDSGTIDYTWTFGDGNTSDSTSPDYSYTGAGNYTVKLTATSDKGCIDSAWHEISVLGSTAIDFTVNDTAQCLNGNSFEFTSSVSGVGYAWTFGDGNSSSDSTPTHSYTAAGTYTVKLVTTSGSGCKDSISRQIKVLSVPAVAFTVSDSSQCMGGNSFSFTNNTTGATGYTWDFGDANTSNAASPAHSYAATGTFSVKLVAVSAGGCKDSLVRNVKVNTSAVAAFTVNDSTQCINGNNFSFTNTSTNAAVYSWSFGDGGSSANTSPARTYTGDGSYTVKLVATSADGCKDSITRRMEVYAQPEADFTVNDSTQCISGNSFDFTNTSAGGTSFVWLFGDGGSSISPSPAHTYSRSDTFAVLLIATNGYGCLDSMVRNIEVYGNPAVSFGIDDSTQCLNNNSFSFTNNTTGATAYTWTFGDGNSSNSTSPGHSYSTSGAYTVKLVAASANGCKDSVIHSISVYDMPVAAFTVNDSTQCIRGNSFSFTNNSTGATTYAWTFGDGNTSNSTSPSHTYSSNGTYTVKLAATSGNGCKDSVSHSTEISVMPSAAFTTNDSTQCQRDNLFAFTNTSSISTGTNTYAWRFGDGDTSTNFSPSHYYRNDGTYTVKLIATSDKSCKDSVTHSARVYDMPVAAFSINKNAQCLTGNSFVFTNNSTEMFTSAWTFGDGGSSADTSVTHSYANYGAYSVRLIVTSSRSCKDTLTRNVQVYAKPTAAFAVNDTTQCLAGNSFDFTNNSTIGSGTNTYAWSFSDGGSSNSTYPNHSYTADGSYDVKLVATSNNGCKDSVTLQVTVYPMPVAAFAANDSTQCLSGNSFSFANTSTGAAAYRWTFGDGGQSADAAPDHAYTAEGQYDVKLVATSADGCQDSVLHTAAVYPQPAPAFTANDSTQCLGSNGFVFANATTISTGTSTYAWTLGDGNGSTDENPIYVYSAHGTYTVKLVATSDQGCTDSLEKEVTVYPMPAVGFSVNDTAQCLNGNSFTFTNASTIATGTMNHSWNFSDGNTGNATDPVHVYLADDTYEVKLAVTSGEGCTDSASHIVIVHPQPVPAFVINDSLQCMRDNSFSFNNISAINTGAIAVNAWIFGDSDTSSLISPDHSYAAPGKYEVTLTTASDFGCTEMITDTVAVFEQPVAGFTIVDTAQCLRGNVFDLQNTSTILDGSLTFSWSFGDASTDTARHIIKTYSNSGTYPVELVAVSNESCTDTARVEVKVFAHPVAQIIETANPVCDGDTAVFETANTGKLLWFSNGVATIDTWYLYPTITPDDQVRLLVENDEGCQDTSAIVTAVFNALPAKPAIIRTDFTLDAGSGYDSYQWHLDGQPISGAEQQTHEVTANGEYSVWVTNASNCGIFSDTVTVGELSIHTPGKQVIISLYPNPSNGQVYLSSPAEPGTLHYALYNTLGQLLAEGDAEKNQAISLPPVTGVYHIHLTGKGINQYFKVTRQ